MGEAYDIDGYLNWGTFITRGEYGPEVYETQASVWNNSNGDGWIAYPGKWYGVDGPIASLRLVAMRDGMQDRALLEMFVKKYEEKVHSHRNPLRSREYMDYRNRFPVFRQVDRQPISKALARTTAI